MRKKALIYLAILAVLWGAVAYVFRDHLIERAIERAASAVWGARVEIDGLHVSLLKLYASWNRLQVADRRDPWKNVLETGPAALDVEVRPLFWKRLIVREMSLDAVRTGTPRATDGRLPRRAQSDRETPGLASRVGKALQAQLRSLPVMNLSALKQTVNPASLVDVQALQSVRMYAHLRREADSSLALWQTRLRDLPFRQQLDSLEQDIARLQLRKPATVAELTQQLRQLQALRNRIERLQNQLRQIRGELDGSLARLRQRLAEADRALTMDIQRAQKLARLGELDIRDVGLLLFGRPLVERYEQLLRWIDTAREYAPVARSLVQLQKQERPPRFRGQDIPFPFHARYPRLLIRKMAIRATETGKDTARVHWLRGEVLGLTNEPAVYGHPTRFDLFVGSAAGNQYRLSGALDHTGEEPRDTLRIEARQVALGRLSLGSEGFLPRALLARQGQFRLTGIFVGDRVDLELEAEASPVEFEFPPSGRGEPARMVRQVLSDVRKITLKARLTGSRDQYRLRLTTNLDRLLGRRIKAALEQRLQAARHRLATYVRAEAEQRRKAAAALLAKQERELRQTVQQWQTALETQLARLEQQKREWEAQLKQKQAEARKAAEKKARGALKQLFKKKKN